MTDRERLHEACVLLELPDYMHEGIVEYVCAGRRTGHFLEALLRNDLTGSFSRADNTNLGCMRAWVGFVYNEVPSMCRRENVDRWIEFGGLDGGAPEKIAAEDRERADDQTREVIFPSG